MTATDAALFATLSPDEQAEAMKMLADLHERGYRTVDSHHALHPGARIRHRGHQFPQAYTNGTGVVWAIAEKNPSGWSDSWGMPDVELIPVWDEQSFGGRVSQVAQYHVEAIGAVR